LFAYVEVVLRRSIMLAVFALSLAGCDGVLSFSAPLIMGDASAGADLAPAPDSGSPNADLTSGKSDGPAGPAGQDAGPSQADTGVVIPPDASSSPDQGTAPTGIWRPKPGTSWQWQLMGKVDTSINVAMYDIDLFDSSSALIAQLKGKGKVVICYFSAGSYEAWRPDAKDFPSAVRGSKMDGWDELWLDIRAASVKAAMAKRLDLAASKGCDGVEPDNVDGYDNSSGFPLKGSDQLAYNIWLAQQAHARGLSIGLKNDLAQVKALEPHFDWALNEECVQYNECGQLQPFINAGKAVFHVEYSTNKSQVCGKTQPLQFDTLLKKLDLDAWYVACWK
jgi:hypothetical protein